MKKPRTPSGLKAAGKRFWKEVLSEYVLKDSHDLERLAMAAKCLDDLVDIEARVQADGMFVLNRYKTPVEHPGCKMIRDNRMLFVKIVRELGFDLVTAKDSRPPRQY